MTDFENLIYFIPICGLILVCFFKCCYYDLSNKNINNVNNINQLENINYTERIPIINDRFPVILYTVENNNNNIHNNEYDIDLENNNISINNLLKFNNDLEPPKYENL